MRATSLVALFALAVTLHLPHGKALESTPTCSSDGDCKGSGLKCVSVNGQAAYAQLLADLANSQLGQTLVTTPTNKPEDSSLTNAASGVTDAPTQESASTQSPTEPAGTEAATTEASPTVTTLADPPTTAAGATTEGSTMQVVDTTAAPTTTTVTTTAQATTTTAAPTTTMTQQCSSDADCPANAPVCNAGVCETSCSDHAQCSSHQAEGKGWCSIPPAPEIVRNSKGQCTQCYYDESTSKHLGCNADKPLCWDGVCQTCQYDENCSWLPDTPKCAYYQDNAMNMLSHCVSKDCNNANDCTDAFPVCTPTIPFGWCSRCTADADCASRTGKPKCVLADDAALKGQCVECLADADCTGNTNGSVCKADNTCGTARRLAEDATVYRVCATQSQADAAQAAADKGASGAVAHFVSASVAVLPVCVLLVYA